MNTVKIRNGSSTGPQKRLDSHVEFKLDSVSGAAQNKPAPNDFDAFMPWACTRLLDVGVVITKTTQEPLATEILRTKSRMKSQFPTKTNESSSIISTSQISQVDNWTSMPFEETSKPKIRVNTVYSKDNLVEINFQKEQKIPVTFLKVIRLIISFYPQLTRITMSTISNEFILHELSKLLPLSNLTEIVLDDSYFKIAHYEVLLEKPGNLNYLSLARCRISDEVFKAICEQLQYPLPASKTLTVLNMSSNHISDTGASYIARSLRSNRTLKYLNLSGNKLTDKAACMILSSLKEFPLTREEEQDTGSRYLEYVKEKKDFIISVMKSLKESAQATKGGRETDKKSPRLTSGKFKKRSRTGNLDKPKKAVFIRTKSDTFDKADSMARIFFGDFDEPLSINNTCRRNGVTYSFGNTTLSYLNLSFNNVTIFTLKDLIEVLTYQSDLNLQKSGLINIRIDGNPIPVNCTEYSKIDSLFEEKLLAYKAINKNKPRLTLI